MHSHVKFLGRSGSRISGVWKWVTRWGVGGNGGYRIIEVLTEIRRGGSCIIL